MATIQLMSDLHLEFLSPKERTKFFKDLDPKGVDVLVLAGDICSFPLLREVLKAFAGAYPNVVYITGNHEFYGSSPDAVHGALWDIQVENKNLEWLHNQMVEVAGLKFFGGTLWFPRPDGKTLQLGKWSLNDYNKIRNFEPWVYDENAICEALMKVLVPRADVVVTHHLPHPEMIATRYRDSVEMNHFFCRDLSRQIEEWKPKVWMFGHTHDRIQKQVGETLFLCNSKGYPNEKEFEERGPYQKKLLVSVEPGPGKATILSGR